VRDSLTPRCVHPPIALMLGLWRAAQPDHNDPSGKTWLCRCYSNHSCSSFGAEPISGHGSPQFKGDPTPVLTAKFNPGYWYSTTHENECGNPRANASEPCTWQQHRGKIVNASCVNSAVLSAALSSVSADVKACEVAEDKTCDYLNAVQTNLTNCCIAALVKGVNGTDRAAIIGPFVAAFNSDDPAKGGCPELAPPSIVA